MRDGRVWWVIAGLTVVFAGAGLAQQRDSASNPGQSGPSEQAVGQPGKLPALPSLHGRMRGEPIPPQEGDTCLVCGKPVSKEDYAYRIDGQRVAVHRLGCYEALSQQPDRWLSRIKASGAFLDARSAELGLSSIWLGVGTYVLLGLIFGALAAHRAFRVGRNPRTWMGIGFLTNLPGFVFLLALPKGPIETTALVPPGLTKIASTYAPAACPACGAENHPSADQCSSCGATLTPQTLSEVQKIGLASS